MERENCPTRGGHNKALGFFVVPDESAKRLTICPGESKARKISLSKAEASLLAKIILQQIQEW